MEVWIGLAVIVVALVAAGFALTRRRWGSWSHLDDAYDEPDRQDDASPAHRRPDGQ